MFAALRRLSLVFLTAIPFNILSVLRYSVAHSPPTREGRGECGDARNCRLPRYTARWYGPAWFELGSLKPSPRPSRVAGEVRRLF